MWKAAKLQPDARLVPDRSMFRRLASLTTVELRHAKHSGDNTIESTEIKP